MLPKVSLAIEAVDDFAEAAGSEDGISRDRDPRERLGAAARERVRERFLTVREVEDHLSGS